MHLDDVFAHSLQHLLILNLSLAPCHEQQTHIQYVSSLQHVIHYHIITTTMLTVHLGYLLYGLSHHFIHVLIEEASYGKSQTWYVRYLKFSVLLHVYSCEQLQLEGRLYFVPVARHCDAEGPYKSLEVLEF